MLGQPTAHFGLLGKPNIRMQQAAVAVIAIGTNPMILGEFQGMLTHGHEGTQQYWANQPLILTY